MNRTGSAAPRSSTSVSYPARATLLAVYVASSSVLGLGPGVILLLSEHNSPVAGFLNVWRASPPADAVFVAGSIAAAMLTMGLARRRPLLAVVAGYFLSIPVYALAFLLALGADHNRPDPSNLWPVAIIVFQYGQLGLIFAAVAPLLWKRAINRWRRGSTRASSFPPGGLYKLDDRTRRQEEARDLTDGPMGNWRL